MLTTHRRFHFIILITLLGIFILASLVQAQTKDSRTQFTDNVETAALFPGVIPNSMTWKAEEEYFVYLPIVLKPATPSTGNIAITYIHYDGTGNQEPDEYVEIRNVDSMKIQLDGWTLRDIANHVYTFPDFVINPDQVCRVYTNEDHPEWCGFSYENGAPIWNNKGGDCAYMRDSSNAIIDTLCYP